MRKQNLNLIGKRGNVVLDGIMVLIVLFVFSLVVIGGFMVANNINDDLQADSDIQNKTKEAVDNMTTNYNGFFDNLFIFLLVLITGFVIVLSFLIDSQPIYFVFAFVLLIALFFIAGSVSNAFEDFANTDGFDDTNTDFPKMYFVMTHLIETIIIITSLVLIALYGKSRSGGGI